MPGVDVNPTELPPEDRQLLETWEDLLAKTWSEGRLAELFPTLPPPGNPLRMHLLIRLVRNDMAFRCQRGRRAQVEDYLKKYPELLAVAAVAVDLMWLEHQLHEKYGIPISNPSMAIPTQSQGGEGAAKEGATVPPGRPPVLPRIPLELPEAFGRYRILKKLGSGNSGSVYQAHDTHLQRRVALKVPRFRDEDGPDALLRFWRDGKALAKLRHPNVCPLLDVSVFEGIPFVTMTFVEGPSLASQIEPGKPWPLRRAVILVHKLAEALAYAHELKVTHRDLRPCNVLLGGGGEPILTDFALARRPNRASIIVKAGQGTVLSTLPYMAPEQVNGDVKTPGPTCDIYSLGVILYELLTGRTPFQGTYGDVVVQILTQAPDPPSKYRPGLPAELEAVCLSALAKKPADRFASMQEFATALDNCQKLLAEEEAPAAPTSTVRGQRRRLLPVLVGGLAIVGLIAGGVYYMKRPKEVPEQPPPPVTPEPAAGTPGTTWKGHKGTINAMALSADGTRAVSADGNGLVLLWDVKSGKRLERFTVQPFSDVYCIALSRDGKQVAVGTANGDIHLWLPEAKTEAKRLTGHRDAVHSVAFSPNGERLVSGGADGKLKLWNHQAGKFERDLEGEGGIVRAAFIRDGKQLLSGASNGRVRFWDLAGAQAPAHDEHQGQVWTVSVAPDGRKAATFGEDGKVCLWDCERRSLIKSYQALGKRVNDAQGCVLAISADGRGVLFGGPDGQVRLWDPMTDALKEETKAREGSLRAASFLGTRPWLAMQGPEDPQTGTPILIHEGINR